jgi:hypothetical protein
MPQTKDVISRLPPTLKTELGAVMEDLDSRLPASAKRPRQDDMLGVLLVAARGSSEKLPEAVAIYFEIERAFEAEGSQVSSP